MVAEAVGFGGTIRRDETKPDGTPRKLMDSGLLTGMGWHPQIALHAGIASTYRWFLENNRG